MRQPTHSFALSPSALTRFLGCEHRTYLDILERRGELGEERRPPDMQMLFDRGIRHEDDILQRFLDEGRDVAQLTDEDADRETLAARTREAMEQGVEILHQACFSRDGWVGYPDFLIRVPTPSDLGDWSYEVHDAKLSGHAEPRHIFQLLFYNEELTRLQGLEPERMHLMLGDDTQPAFRPDEFEAYAANVRSQFVARHAELEGPDADPAYPYKVGACDFCHWWHVCDRRRRDDDHVSLTATVYRAQGLKLEASELRRLPQPSAGDVHFDFEGDPNWGDEGLEYLFGTVYDEAGAPVYYPLWAVSRAEERLALETWIDWLTARLERFPDLHVFHYNSYETVALKKLVARHSTREAELDDLLRREVFVDLYGIVRQGIRAGTEGYGLKALEPVFGFERNAELRGAIGSLRRWQAYMEDGEQPHLDGIAGYNEDDCLSTRALYTWLLDRRPEAEAKFGIELASLAPKPANDLTEKALEHQARVEGLRDRLLVGLPDDEREDDTEQRARRMAFNLVGYHRREAKPVWWAMFDRRERTIAQLRDEDSEALADLTVVGCEKVGKSLQWTLSFPTQDYKLSPGEVDEPLAERAASLVSIDEAAQTVVVKRGPKHGEDPPLAVGPGGPYRTGEQEEALFRFADVVADTGLDRADVGVDLLLRRPPRFLPGTPPLVDEPAGLERLKAQVRGLDQSVLVIQGPPGTGKTYTGGRLAVDLLQRGLSVGVMATSHKAINNLVEAIDEAADEAGVDFRGWKKCTKDDDAYESARVVSSARRPSEDDGPITLVAATAWHWAHNDQVDAVDVLFVDEAGQVSLADAIAVAGAATNVVLLGDPQQLAHVSQGTHAVGTGASVLEHLLGDHDTVPPDRGVLLATSWRMHPDISDFISKTMYDGRLSSVAGCELHRVDSPGLSGSGLRMIGVEHADNRGRSIEEADRVADEVARLLDGGTFVDRHGVRHPLTLDDILVVAPYNAQVRCLKASLPAGARVGTVDKFQGQEAPVVLFSMASSTGDDVARGMSFLFSRNRLNVAVSRAQALAVVVCSPALMGARCSTVEDMRLVNMLCRFAEAAA
jgi:predicted RecB family nuclease